MHVVKTAPRQSRGLFWLPRAIIGETNMSLNVLVTMVTTTSYGTWLPGDARGYVEDGKLLPPNPRIQAHAESLTSRTPVHFSTLQQVVLFDALCKAADEFGYRLTDASVES